MTTEWLTAEECNDRVNDHHYDSTVDNLRARGISTILRCWREEVVFPAEIDPYQLIDEDDVDGDLKAESIRRTLRGGGCVPPAIVLHRITEDGYPYELIEGRHRYNAAHRERLPVSAWVAHAGCCGGPPADLPV